MSCKEGIEMKNAKKPTKKEKMHIQSYSLNPENWLIFKNLSGELHLVHRYTNQIKIIPSL